MILMFSHFKQLKFYSAKLHHKYNSPVYAFAKPHCLLKILFYYIGNRRKSKDDYCIKATYVRRKYYTC